MFFCWLGHTATHIFSKMFKFFCEVKMLVSHCEMVVRKFQGKKHQLTSVNYFEIAWLYRSVQCVTVLKMNLF